MFVAGASLASRSTPLMEAVMRIRISVSRQLSSGREAPAHALFWVADFIP